MNFINKLLNLFNIYFRKDKILLSKPIGSTLEYQEIFNRAKKLKIEEIEKLFDEREVIVEKNWFDELALKTQIVIKKSEINYYHGKLLYFFLTKYLDDNKFDEITILETGTARGYSSICMSKALNDRKQKGKIFTIDILPNNKKMYWNCIEDHKGKNTRLDLLQPWKNELKNIVFIEGRTKKKLKKMSFDRINFAFLDAAHTYKDVINEFNFVSNLQKKGDVIFFDDYSPEVFNPVVKAINEIEKLNKYRFEKIYSTEQRGYAVAYKL